MADTVDHTHGDTGVKPAQDLNFQTGGFPNPEVFDWFWSEVPAAVNDHADLLGEIDSDEDGVVDAAEYAQNTDSYKGNDLDSDGDGKVDAAETADVAAEANYAQNTDSYKNNDLDSDGDGKVDAAETADTAISVDGADVDGQVSSAQSADVADQATRFEVRTNDPSNPDDGQVWIRSDL